MTEFKSARIVQDYRATSEETQTESTRDDVVLESIGIDFFKIYLKLVQENDKLRDERNHLENQIGHLERKVDLLQPCCLVRNCCKFKYWLIKTFCPCFFPCNKDNQVIPCLSPEECAELCGGNLRERREPNSNNFNITTRRNNGHSETWV